jgi:hypothetical protein
MNSRYNKAMRNRQHEILGVILVCMLFLVGCQTPAVPVATQVSMLTDIISNPNPTAIVIPTTVPTPSIPVYGPDEYPDGMDPLTGLMADDPALLERCPMVIKVSNYPRSGRPHAGLSQADLVFDYYIGEGMNRFAAIYYGQDAPKVGPVRSGRLVDAQLTTMYQGILAFKGAWYKVNEVLYSNLKKRAISGSPSTCPGICDTGEETVISMFANTAGLSQYALEKGICANTRPMLGGMVFSEELPEDGRQVSGLSVIFSYYNRAEWRYDEASDSFLRWIEDISGEEGQEIITMVPLLDANTGQQLAFDNVVILFVRHDMYAETYFDMQLQKNTNGARVVLLRDGKAFDGIWKSVKDDRPLQFFTNDGDPLAFKPGNTWLVITGARSTLTTPLNEIWELTNYLP